MAKKIIIDKQKKEVIDKIINQINSLNKKFVKFEKEGITSHREYVNNFFGDLVEYNASGSITKSKNFYKDKSQIELEKILAISKKVNNHYVYGTVNKYNSELSATLEKTRDYARNLLLKKGYNSDWIEEIVNDNGFMVKLLDGFNARGKSFGSDQVTEKVALEYKPEGIDPEEMQRTLFNIESNRLAQERILEEKQAFEEWKRNGRQR